MDRRGAPPSIDSAIADLATRQHGVVSRAQLRRLGLSADAIDQRLRRDRLHLVHRGVYAVGHRRLDRTGDRLAALLAIGPCAVLSHRSAAAVWRVQPPFASYVDVTVPARGGRKRRRGITVHRSATLATAHVTERGGLPVTTPARTLIDLAEVVPPYRLRRAVDEAERLRLFDGRACARTIDQCRGRSGAAALAALLAAHDGESRITRSQLEDRFLELCIASGLPAPRVGEWLTLDGQAVEVDFLWRAPRLIAELDGFETHGTRAAFERDRRRDRKLRLAGWQVVRFTWRDLSERPGEVIDDLRFTGRP